MRVIAGRLGGRMFDTPGTFKTHPMSEKVRGALFNMLGDIGGLTVLDAFAGSGALSFEALSRGAASALAIDNDTIAQKTIQANTRKLGLQRQLTLIKAPAAAWISTNVDVQFDLVLCDPPYNDLQQTLIAKLANYVRRPKGILVLSWPGGQETPTLPGLQKLAHREYGDAQLQFYQVES